MSNLKKTVDDLGLASLGCSVHLLQFEGLLLEQSVSDIVASVRKIVGHFRELHCLSICLF